MYDADYQQSLRLLEEFHQFPGEYTFKIIGPNREDWQAAVRQAAESVLGNIGDCLRPAQRSSGERYLSLTLQVHVSGAEEVMRVYAVLRQVAEVKMLV